MFRKDPSSRVVPLSTPENQARARQAMPVDDAPSLFDSHELFTITVLNNLIFDYVPLDGLNPKKNDTEYKEEAKAESKKEKCDIANYYAQPKVTLFAKRLPVMALLQATVAHKNDEVKYMLDKAVASSKDQNNPELLRELLLASDTVTDHAGRTHKNRTGYQLALGARDYNVISDKGNQVVDGLVEIYCDYFRKLPDGELLRKPQYDTQLTAASAAEEDEKAASDSLELIRLINVVTAASDADCQQIMALDSFHGFDLHPKSWATGNDEVIASAIYLAEAKEGLAYRVRGLDAEVRQGVIAHDQLAKKFQKLVAETTARGGDLKQLPKEFPKSVDAIIKEKSLLSPLLLELVAEAGYIYTAKQIELLKTQSEAVVKVVKDEAFDAAYNKLQATIELFKMQSEAIVKAPKDEKEEAFDVACNKLQAMQVETILQNPVNFDLLKALYRLRNHLEPKGNYTAGHYFNSQLLLAVYQQYDTNYQQFGNSWSKPKNVFCWQKIVGLAQGLLPGCDAQVIEQGIYYVMANGDKSKPSFSFTYGGGTIFPLDSDAAGRWDIITRAMQCRGLQIADALLLLCGARGQVARADAAAVRPLRSGLENLYRAKTSAAKLMLPPDKQSSQCCVIM